jgi:membrane protease YdiL (CAAX protease family)
MNWRFRHWIDFSLVRLVVYLVLLGAGLRALLLLFDLYLETYPPDPLSRGLAWFVVIPYLYLAGGVSSILIYYGLVAGFERRPVSELARPKSVRLMLAGALLGAGLVAIYHIVLIALGNASLQITGQSTGELMQSLRYAATLCLGAAAGEEILFRGVLFRILEQSFGTSLSMALSALIFAAAHVTNPHFTITDMLEVSAGGLMMATAYGATRRLWLPIGIHFGWDFGLGGLFSNPKDLWGIKPLIDVHLQGADHLTGGAFTPDGPEDLVIALVVCLTAAGLFGWRAKREGLWQPVGLRLRRREAIA